MDLDVIEINSNLDNGYPYYHKLDNFVDDRGWSLMNLLGGQLNGGQINVSSMHPGVVKAWHKHAKQIDFWIPIRGTLKCAIYNPEKKEFHQYIVGEKNPAIIAIPRGCWHGCMTVGNEVATLLYYVTEEYNIENPDEERVPVFEHISSHWKVPANFVWDIDHK